MVFGVYGKKEEVQDGRSTNGRRLEIMTQFPLHVTSSGLIAVVKGTFTFHTFQVKKHPLRLRNAKRPSSWLNEDNV